MALWITSDIITAAKLNKSFNSGLDANKGTPSVIGEAYLATDTDIIYYSTNGTSWDKRFLNAQDKNNLIQMIQQVHPVLQVLAAMNELTYFGITKSGNNYILELFLCTLYPYSTTSETTVAVPNLIYTVTATGTVTIGLDALRTPADYGGSVSYRKNGGSWIAIFNYGAGVDAAWYTRTVTSVAVTAGDTIEWGITSVAGATIYTKNYTVNQAQLTGNILLDAVASVSAVLSFFKHLKTLVSNGGSTHATPVQAEIYGNADSYATPLNSTKFTIAPADPRIILKRDALDTITASSASQTVWNMTVAGGMPALPNHGSILATQIGVAFVLVVEKSILGDFSDTVVLAENTDYVVDSSTRTAIKITLTSGTGIVNAQSKIRISWIADVLKVGATNNTALKIKLYLNRTATSEASPSIQPLPLGTAKYAELQYCI